MNPKDPDILNQLKDDARRYRVARTLPTRGDLSEEQVCMVAADFAQFLDRTGTTLGKVANALGAGYTQSVLSQFKSIGEDGRSKYGGNASKVARAVNIHMEKHALKAEAWRPEGFILTEVARNIIAVVQKAITMPTIAVISGDAGRGKTMTLKACYRNHVGSVLIRVRRNRRSSTGLARALGKALQIKGATTGAQFIDKVIDKLDGTGRVIFIDEAHQLTEDALELLRDIHDECGKLPIILSGTYDINQKTAGHDIFYGQLSSRIGLRYDINERARGKGGGGDRNSRMTKPIHSMAEIMELFTDDKLRLTEDALEFLFKLANVEGRGGIRLPEQVLMVVASVPANKGKKISARTLRSALAEMHGHAIAKRQIQRSVDALEVKAG